MGGTDFDTGADETVALGCAVHLQSHFPRLVQLAVYGQIEQTFALRGDTVERIDLDIDGAEDAQPR